MSLEVLATDVLTAFEVLVDHLDIVVAADDLTAEFRLRLTGSAKPMTRIRVFYSGHRSRTPTPALRTRT